MTFATDPLGRPIGRPRRRTRWRWLLAVPVLVIVLLAAVLVGTYVYIWTTADVDTVGEVDFDRPLAIPPLAESRVDDDGRRVFDLTLQRGEADLARPGLTPTWGVNGDYLGPTLRAERGEEVLVNVRNEVGEPTTLHWHGMHLPAEMDGGPHQLIDHGDTWSPHWEIDQPAATLWYHPHPHEETAEHVYRGLAGLFILDHPVVSPSLPHEYGVDDVPLIVQDKKYDGSELDTSDGMFRNAGIFGDQILVNGTPGPYLDVTTERIRLRLLNASNARIYNFHFDDDRSYQLVATDGGLLPEPIGLTHLELSPGERAEIVVAMAPGETTVLRSAPLDSSGNRLAGADDRMDILQLRAADELAASPQVPDRLAPAPDIDDEDVVEDRRFDLSGTGIDGENMDPERIDVAVEVGTTERWQLVNTNGYPHNFHIHDVQFLVESVDGEPPPPAFQGWQDTVLVPDNAEVVLLVRFTDYTDPDTPYMYHCHLLRHEDRGMMGQFVVVSPGEEAGDPGHHH